MVQDCEKHRKDLWAKKTLDRIDSIFAPKSGIRLPRSIWDLVLLKGAFPTKTKSLLQVAQKPPLFGYILSRAGRNGNCSQKEREGQRWQGRRNKQIDGEHCWSGDGEWCQFKDHCSVYGIQWYLFEFNGPPQCFVFLRVRKPTLLFWLESVSKGQLHLSW